jgi:hypothetical protein
VISACATLKKKEKDIFIFFIPLFFPFHSFFPYFYYIIIISFYNKNNMSRVKKKKRIQNPSLCFTYALLSFSVYERNWLLLVTDIVERPVCYMSFSMVHSQRYAFAI